MFFCRTKFLDPSLNMPVDNYNDDKSYRPVLRPRTQTFVNLSSKYSTLPDSSSYSTSSFISPYKREGSGNGRITTAYAIRVTAVNNHRDGLLRTHIMDEKDNNNAASVRVVTIKKPQVVDKPLPVTPVATPVNVIEDKTRDPSHPRPDDKRESRVKPILRETCSSKMPLPGIVEQAGELDVLDIEGNPVPFRNLYLPSPDLTEKARQEKPMVIFIRPSFCSRLRRGFVKTFLSSLKGTAATLPKNSRLTVVWCGSYVRLRRLIESTQCSFPIYADPNGRIYQLLEKTCTATGGESYRAAAQQQQQQQHASVSSYLPTAALTNLVQAARLIGEGNPLSSRDTRHHVGAAFLFETSETVRITWSYRIANDSAHAEADVIRRVLGGKGVREEKQAKLSTKSSGGSESTFNCIYGLPKARSSHRWTVSCTEGAETWRPRILCLAY